LVDRHGRMALGVCRRILGDSSEADDAFQATLLVLIDRAEELHRSRVEQRSVGGWLHRVAANAALQIRRESKSRKRREATFARARAGDSKDSTIREALPILDEEIRRLPDRYRAPLVLYYFQDHSQQGAADELGISYATLRRRLDQGRELLRNRLARRGCSIAPTVFAVVLWDSAAQADELGPSTAEELASPLLGKVDVPSRSVRISQEVLRMMRNQMIRRSVGLAMLLLLLLGSTGLVARDGLAADGPQAKQGQAAKVADGKANPNRRGSTKEAPPSRSPRLPAKLSEPAKKTVAPAPKAENKEDTTAIDREILDALKGRQGQMVFQGSISINGQTRPFNNREDFAKAQMPMIEGVNPFGNQPNPAAQPNRAVAPVDEGRIDRQVKSALKKAAAAKKRRAAKAAMPGVGGMPGMGGVGVAGGMPGFGFFGGMNGQNGMSGMGVIGGDGWIMWQGGNGWFQAPR
jgi:RNA polymerase sigma factor (sigma-70 family)